MPADQRRRASSTSSLVSTTSRGETCGDRGGCAGGEAMAAGTRPATLRRTGGSLGWSTRRLELARPRRGAYAGSASPMPSGSAISKPLRRQLPRASLARALAGTLSAAWTPPTTSSREPRVAERAGAPNGGDLVAHDRWFSSGGEAVLGRPGAPVLRGPWHQWRREGGARARLRRRWSGSATHRALHGRDRFRTRSRRRARRRRS